MIEHITCRACGSFPLQVILSLGSMPPANSYLTAEQLSATEPTYPLNLAFCEKCTLAQITVELPPQELFGEYLYFSSYSDTMVDSMKSLARRLLASRGLNDASLVVELASNDGYLLQHYVAQGIPVLGIEPAQNVAKAAQAKGIRTLAEFFDRSLALRLSCQGISADVVHANNVLAHVADLNGFVEGIRILLKDDGVAVVEVPYVKDLIDRLEFDTIYHEHLGYFSLSALDLLFLKCGMKVAHVERIPVHGGSLRIFATHQDRAQRDETVKALLEEETNWGVHEIEIYRQFAENATAVKTSLLQLLQSLKARGKSIAGYGAAAKGTVLLNYCKIDKRILDFVADRSPHKQGRYMPGVHIPIYAPARLLERMPDYTLMLAWNLADEILEQQKEYRRRGGKFITPLPKVRII